MQVNMTIPLKSGDIEISNVGGAVQAACEATVEWLLAKGDIPPDEDVTQVNLQITATPAVPASNEPGSGRHTES